MKTSELFEKELLYIQNDDLRQITANTLDHAPEYFQTIPASSSGKYHPIYALGNGGLIRHVKAAVGIARSLIQTDIFKHMIGIDDLPMVNVQEFADAAYAALILHDCYKGDDTPEHKTVFDHPNIAAKMFLKEYKDFSNHHYVTVVLACMVDLVFRAIKSHMGQWNKVSYSSYVLEKPKTGLEWFVHLCDYLASRRFLEFNFDAFAEVGR